MRVSRRAGAAAGLAIVLAAVLGSGSALASSGGSLYVNGSTGQDVGTCRLSSNPCQTIGYALTKVTANSTIHVAAGTYAEQVTIPSNLTVTITGPTTGTATIEPSTLPSHDVDTDSSKLEYAIVDVQPNATLRLNHFTIDGSAASSQFNGCADDFVGVYYNGASGSMSADTVQNIVLPTPDFGCQDGQGVYVATAPGDTATVSMSNVKVSNYDKNGITCDDPGTSCTIKHATVTGIGPTPLTAQNGIQIWDANGSVSHSTVTANSYTNPDYPSNFYGASGILVIDAGTLSLTYDNVHANDTNIYADEEASDYGLPQTTLPQGVWTISNNNASGAVNSNSAVPFGAGIGDGIDLLDVSGVDVVSNVSNHSAEYGIGLFGAGSNTITSNTASSNGGGVYIGTGYSITDSVGNTLDGNTASNNKSAGDPAGSGDGIFADTTSSGNIIENSTLSRNLDYDAYDQSTGSGTSGTANSWYSNSCSPANDSDPAGLCNATPPPANAAMAAIAHLVAMHRQVQARPVS